MNTNAQQYRHEFKYIVSVAQIPLLRSRISCFKTRTNCCPSLKKPMKSCTGLLTVKHIGKPAVSDKFC